MAGFGTPSPKKSDWEKTQAFTPRFGPDGLLTVVTIDADDGVVLMLAHMNAEAVEKTLETGIVHYWSRSRQSLWKKGETSGNTQALVEMRTDCDQDALIVAVRTGANGANCHTGRRSCFYRTVVRDADTGDVALVFDERDQPRFDPDDVYGKS